MITIKQQLIYWHPGTSTNGGDTQIASVHLLADTDEDLEVSFGSFEEMVAALRTSFPQVKSTEVFPRQLKQWTWKFGNALIIWTAELEKKSYPGWQSIDLGPGDKAKIAYQW